MFHVVYVGLYIIFSWCDYCEHVFKDSPTFPPLPLALDEVHKSKIIGVATNATDENDEFLF